MKKRFLLMIVTVFIAGCSGSGDNDSGLMTGRFLDSAVQGLLYETETNTGTTDETGRFYYQYGETIAFFVGDVKVGETKADSILTPVDLVPGAADETHFTVTNIARLLLSLDLDGNPENGIEIHADIHPVLTGRSIRFDLDAAAFEFQEDVLAVFEDLNAANVFSVNVPRTLFSSEAASAHLADTLLSLESVSEDEDDDSWEEQDGNGGDAGGDSGGDAGGDSGGDSGGG